MSRKLSFTEGELVSELYKKGESDENISVYVGKPLQEIKKWRKERGLPKNPGRKTAREPLYGPNWNVQRRRALKRDGFACRKCNSKENLCVHHIMPFDHFEDYEEANSLNNLITLCRSCHLKIERRKWSITPL